PLTLRPSFSVSTRHLVDRFRRVTKRQQRNHLLEACCSVRIGTQIELELRHPPPGTGRTAEESDMQNPGTATPERFPAQERFADGAQFIAGRLTKGTSGRTHAVVDPATGEEVYTYELAGPDDVDAAVAAAREAFPGWAATTPGERSDALHRFAAVLAERAEDFARAESLQCGKPLKLTR